ncbi:MAG TPA: hypothetical protein VF008_23465 [Niastella sp.]
MKKLSIIIPFLSLLIVLFTACSKDDKVTVYRPPSADIHFSNVSDLIVDSLGKTIAVKAQITADNGIQQIALIYEPWGLNKVITSFPDPAKYDLNDNIVIPKNAALQIHSLKIEVTDKKGDKSFIDIKVGLQDLNYATLYLSDVKSQAELTGNLFGVPIAMDKISSHTYQITYYARNDNTQIRCIPNPTSLTPVAIGLDAIGSTKLSTDANRSQPIILAQKGYYKITINTLLLNYSVEQVAPQGTPYDQVALVGRGFYDYPNMNWQNSLPDIILLDKSPVNPFLFTKTVKLGIPPGQSYNTAQFILTTNNGWTNFWRFDKAVNPARAVFNGGTNADIPITGTPQSYLIVFDSQTGIIQALNQ